MTPLLPPHWMLVGALVAAAPAARAAEGGRDALNPSHAIERTALEPFVQKPLFDPARRLPPPTLILAPPPAPPAPEAPPPTVALLGIVEGTRNIAIVRVNGAATTQMLADGEEIAGWTLSVLPSVGLRLRKGDKVVDVALFRKHPPGVTSSVAAPE